MLRSSKFGDSDDDDDDKRRSLQPPRHSDSSSRDEGTAHYEQEGSDDRGKSDAKQTLQSTAKNPSNNVATVPMTECSSPLQPLPNIDTCPQAVSGERSRASDPEPGAVRVRGYNQTVSSLSANERTNDTVLPSAAIVAELVTAVEAEVVREDDLLYRLQETQKRMRLIRRTGCGLVATVVAAAMTIVIILLTRSSPKPTPKPTRKATSKPTIPPATPPPKPTKMCADFPCSSNLTVLELVKGAPNHTRLAGYLAREFNWDLRDYISNTSEAITLFAPTDESFRALHQYPYSFYIDDDSWRLHLWFLLGIHIVPQRANASQIFQVFALPTFFENFVLTVNQTGRTIENDVSIVTTDIKASDGYIQIPDRVIIFEDIRFPLSDLINQTGFVFTDSSSKFGGLLQAAGLYYKLEQFLESGLTLFVPPNSAFDLLDENVKAMLFDTADESYIRSVVSYHILDSNFFDVSSPGEEYALVMSNDVGAWVTSNNTTNETFINSASISETYFAQNGVLHIIDQVLLPPSSIGDLLRITSDVTAEFNVTTFVDLVENHAHLGDLFDGVVEGHLNLGNYYGANDVLTVFAPVDTAFAQLTDPSLFRRLLKPSWLLHLQNLCLHHFTVDSFSDTVGQRRLFMLSSFKSTFEVFSVGNDTATFNGTIDGARILAFPGSVDSVLYAPKGLIQFVDTVLLPPWVSQSVYDIILATLDVSDFFLKVLQFNLQAQLRGTADTPLTLLAPNNDAFGTSNNTLTPQELVLRHTFRGNLYVALLNINQTMVSLSNETFNVQRNGSNTYIGEALIVKPDVLAANGVIHLIDRVL